MKITAVGDIIIGRRIFEEFSGYGEIGDFIRLGDARFFNLETTLNYEGECPASQFSGGTYLRTVPEVLEDIKKFGFNMTSFNNNHAMDFSYEGLYKTMEHLDKSGLVHSGVGKNLAQAAAPKYLDTKNGRVALICVNSSFEDSMIAGEQTARVKGRAGINALRTESLIQVPSEELVHINRIAKMTNVNVKTNISRSEGYALPLADNEAELESLRFVAGDGYKHIVKLNERDAARVEKAIFEAKLQADYIIVSVHSHQLSGTAKENPADFLVEFAHRVIDAGANAVIGHGPHLLRPIEVYKDCPVFYSLGDFVLQLYNVEFAPAEFYEKFSLANDATVHELLCKRSENFTRGLMCDRRMFLSVVPLWETDDFGKLKYIKLLPIELKMEGRKSEIGLPARGAEEEIAEYLNEMCAPYGVSVRVNSQKILECRW